MINERLMRYPMLRAVRAELEHAVDMMYDTYQHGGKILLCGNGGSCADCEHIVGELMKGFLLERRLTKQERKKFDGVCENPEEFAGRLQRAIPAISLPSQCAVLSAFINDVEPDMAYAQLTFGYGKKGDVLIGYSTSGNAKNVVNAVRTAKALGMKTIGLTGSSESAMSELCDCVLHAPSTETYKIQEYHLPIYHFLCAELEKRAFKEMEGVK